MAKSYIYLIRNTNTDQRKTDAKVVFKPLKSGKVSIHISDPINDRYFNTPKNIKIERSAVPYYVQTLLNSLFDERKEHSDFTQIQFYMNGFPTTMFEIDDLYNRKNARETIYRMAELTFA